MTPNWDHYRLASRHRRLVESIARRYGFDSEFAEDVAVRSALKLAVENADPCERLKSKFIWLCKAEFLKRKQEEKREFSISRFNRLVGDEDRAESEIIERIQGGSVPPTQVERVFLSQCIDALEKLPTNHRRTMRKVSMGYSAMDIALGERREILEVLSEIRVARDWVKDHLKWGDDD